MRQSAIRISTYSVRAVTEPAQPSAATTALNSVGDRQQSLYGKRGRVEVEANASCAEVPGPTSIDAYGPDGLAGGETAPTKGEK